MQCRAAQLGRFRVRAQSQIALVPQMRLVKISSSDASDLYVGASESIISEIQIMKTTTQFSVEIYLKDLEPMANPVPGIYIASKEFPNELI